MRQVLAAVLAVLTAAPILPGQTGSKERILAIPAGSTVEVRLKDKTRLSGRLGAVSDAGFELQVERSGAIEAQQIAFDNLRSIRNTVHRSSGHRVGKGLIITLIVVGAVIATAAALLSAHPWTG